MEVWGHQVKTVWYNIVMEFDHVITRLSWFLSHFPSLTAFLHAVPTVQTTIPGKTFPLVNIYHVLCLFVPYLWNNLHISGSVNLLSIPASSTMRALRPECASMRKASCGELSSCFSRVVFRLLDVLTDLPNTKFRTVNMRLMFYAGWFDVRYTTFNDE